LGEPLHGEPATKSAASERTLSLAQRIFEGDPSAEQELVTTYRRGVLVIANARTRDREAALDLAQDVLVAVLQALREGKLREPDKLSAFVNGVARNLINHYVVSRVRRAECEIDDECYTADPVEELETSERKRLVRSELAALPVVDQRILLLSLVDGHSLAEVALRLNMSHEAVRARKSRAIRKIAKKYARTSHR
jgi:RNA polymerase sigma-70 factor (ECF subfamily)